MRAGILAVCLVTVWACSEPLAPDGPGSFAALAAGYQHTCGLQRDGTAYCWGRNSDGQIGTSLTGDHYPLPQVVSTELRFSQIGAGIVHTCALTADGSAYCWGSNFTGVLGHAAVSSSNVPIRVDAGLTFKSIAVGYTHTCALTTDGAAYCWGANDWQQLGYDTSATGVKTPVAVAGGHAFATIAAGYYFNCGIEVEGTAYCWGTNQTGTLGSGDTARASGVPVAVAGGLKFRSIAAGASACGVTTNSAVYCWGSSDWGVSGIGPSFWNRTPQRVPSNKAYAAVSVGALHSCALDVDGALTCWGWDNTDQLGGRAREKCAVGSGPNDYRLCARTPIPVAPGHYFNALSAGAQYNCGLSFDGAALCWGQNDEGQIGNGRVETKTASPSRVPDPPPLPPPPP
jgi:alpha-tubulin suppressor-like RCC1 family protein